MRRDLRGAVLEEDSYEDSPKRSPYELAGLWTANNDARGYVILGDPAVQLPLQGTGKAAHAAPSPDLHRPLEVNTAPVSPRPSETPGAAAQTPAAESAPMPVATPVPPMPPLPPVATPATPAPPAAAPLPPVATPVPPTTPTALVGTARLDAALARLTDAVAESIERSAARLATVEAVDLDGFYKLVQLARSLGERSGTR